MHGAIAAIPIRRIWLLGTSNCSAMVWQTKSIPVHYILRLCPFKAVDAVEILKRPALNAFSIERRLSHRALVSHGTH